MAAMVIAAVVVGSRVLARREKEECLERQET